LLFNQRNPVRERTHTAQITSNLTSKKKLRYKISFNDEWIGPKSQCYKEWVEKLKNEPKKFKDLAYGKIYDSDYLNEQS